VLALARCEQPAIATWRSMLRFKLENIRPGRSRPCRSFATVRGGGTVSWVRVTKKNPCPICHKPDWCLLSVDGSAAICPRVPSERMAGQAGYLHILRDRPPRPPRPAARKLETPADFGEYAAACFDAGAAARRRLAVVLGVSEAALLRLQVGYDAARQAWTFPMRSGASGRIVGIRLRLADGSKLAIRGSKEGLFLPELPPEPPVTFFVTEGASDAAAALDLVPAGWLAVGRPSATGGVGHLVELIRKLRPARVVVFGDNDEVGRRGAGHLADELRLQCQSVTLAFPPDEHKDLRAWKNVGATWAGLQEAIGKGQVVKLELQKSPELGSKPRSGGYWR